MVSPINRLLIPICCILLLQISCGRAPAPTKTQGLFDSVAHAADSLAQRSKEDSLENQFEQNKIFFPTIVALSDKDSLAFIFIDTTLKDILTEADRWDYYKQARKLVPEKILRVHKRIWQLPELREQQAGNGGLYTVVTMITDTPARETDFYALEVRRNYVWRLGVVTDMAMMRYYPATDRIEITNDEGNYMPVAAWRKWEADYHK
jgi:hypothetical protein